MSAVRLRPTVLVLPAVLRTSSESPGRLSAIPGQEFAIIPRHSIDRLWSEGCRPLVLSSLPAAESVDVVLEGVSGLLLVGGEDVEPWRWRGPSEAALTTNPVRDELEFRILDRALADGIPTLGLCRGTQVLNVALGGTLIPDLNEGLSRGVHRTEGAGALVYHEVTVEPAFAGAAGFPEQLRVASVHHQAIAQLGRGLRPIAWSADGVIEGALGEEIPVLAVQWHADYMPTEEPGAVEPFQWLARMSHARERATIGVGR